MSFKAGDTIEFLRGSNRQRGNVVKINGNEVIMNLFAIFAPPGRWYYMGVRNETPINIDEIKEPIVIEG